MEGKLINAFRNYKAKIVYPEARQSQAWDPQNIRGVRGVEESENEEIQFPA